MSHFGEGAGRTKVVTFSISLNVLQKGTETVGKAKGMKPEPSSRRVRRYERRDPENPTVHSTAVLSGGVGILTIYLRRR